MSTEPTQPVVAPPPPRDVERPTDVIEADVPCPCGYNLRGLPETVKCPECGRDVLAVVSELEQAQLDGRARRRLGASLLVANHFVWLCLMTAWYYGIRDELRAVLALLTAAGPRAVTSIEGFRPGTMRAFATSVGTLLLLQTAGLWMLTTVRQRELGLKRLRRFGEALMLAQLAAFAAGAALVFLLDSGDYRLLFSLNLLELPLGVLLGLYVAQLGIAERSRLLTVGGRLMAALLGFSHAAFATGVLLWWRPDTPPQPWFYAGLSASAGAGLILLAAMIYVRVLYRDAAAENYDDRE